MSTVTKRGALCAALSLLALGSLTGRTSAAQDAATPANPAAATQRDWRWVKGAVFVPTNAVNEAQEWDEYDPITNDRELHYAQIYGINCVRVYLHYYIYLKKKDALLREIEDFLTRADRYGIKTEFVFFDDCWNVPDKAILNADYKYPAPIFGVHNSRWLQSPGLEVKADYAANREKLKAYVQDIVNAHKTDKRIAFWETYNEPNHSPETAQILKDAQAWVHETGTPIPLTATGAQFAGDPYSDFKSWHQYANYTSKGGADDLCTECMHRKGVSAAEAQTVPGITSNWDGKTGYELWELGIGRDNCRFAWGENRKTPRKTEAVIPFHGVIYPDGHPWAIADAKALMGADTFAKTPFYTVEYFRDTNFTDAAKTSVSPLIDFDLNDESGTGSPDATVDIPREHFSERWTATVNAPKTGNYTLFADADGSVKVTLDGKKVVEKKDAARKEVSGKLKLNAGTPYKIVVEYVHDAGTGANAPTPSLHLRWSGPGIDKQTILPSAPPATTLTQAQPPTAGKRS